MISVNECTTLDIIAAVNGGAWGGTGFPTTYRAGLAAVEASSRIYTVSPRKKVATYRDLRLSPIFDESTHFPQLVVNQMGFELMCRQESAAGLMLNVLIVFVALLLDWTVERTGCCLVVRWNRTVRNFMYDESVLFFWYLIRVRRR